MVAAREVTEEGYRGIVVADRSKALNMMGVPHERLPRGAQLKNRCPLPRAETNQLSQGLQLWCEYNSWQVCSTCRRIQPRDLTVDGMETVLSPWCPKSLCLFCKNLRSLPTLDSPVEVLQHLPSEVLEALCPLEANYGPHQVSTDRFGRGNGYRVYAAMVTFAWKPLTVQEAVRSLRHADHRRAAETALDWLWEHSGPGAEESAYGEFWEEQEAFRAKNPSADARQRKRWLRFIERDGLECALWPHLFQRRNQCMTWARLQSASRQARGEHKTTLVERGWPEEHFDIEHKVPPDMAGTKRAYMALLFSSVLDPSLSYEILHFTYDLNLWTDLGSKKNLHTGVPLRLMLKNHSFSSEHWLSMHRAVVDLVRQKGYPPIFSTPQSVRVVVPQPRARLGRNGKSWKRPGAK